MHITRQVESAEPLPCLFISPTPSVVTSESMSNPADRPLRIVVMGTGAFAVPMLYSIAASRHHVLAVVTQPLRPPQGNRPAPPSPMRAAAAALGLPILDPQSVNAPEVQEKLQALQPDLFLVADYGQILSPATLTLAPLGGMNLHGSLLPCYRGAAPVNWAIYHGEAQTGVTVLHMTPRIDAGPCLAQASVNIDPDEDAAQLEHRLADLGGPLIAQTVDRFVRGEIDPIPQDKTLATKAPRLKKSDGLLDWNRTAIQLKNQWRALQPWPGCYTWWLRDRAPLRLIVGRIDVAKASPESSLPGTVLATQAEGIVVACGENSAAVLTALQPAGKRMLTAAEFLRGYPVAAGETLGDPQA